MHIHAKYYPETSSNTYQSSQQFSVVAWLDVIRVINLLAIAI